MNKTLVKSREKSKYWEADHLIYKWILRKSRYFLLTLLCDKVFICRTITHFKIFKTYQCKAFFVIFFLGWWGKSTSWVREVGLVFLYLHKIDLHSVILGNGYSWSRNESWSLTGFISACGNVRREAVTNRVVIRPRPIKTDKEQLGHLSSIFYMVSVAIARQIMC